MRQHSPTIGLAGLMLVMAAGLYAQAPGDPLDPAVAAIIAAPLSDADYIDADSCLDRRAVDDVEVIDSNRLLFHGRRDRVWLVQLRSPCIGLDRGSQLLFELRGSRYCSMDTFCARRASNHIAPTCAQQGISICSLGRFEPVSKNQAGLIRESTDRYRHTGVRPLEDAVSDAEAEPEISNGQ
ncbi:MAG: hypothetical protein HC809_07565 [Gammaproteobacteria bacterium]|nr:hypothetical protein [Gammaproteobacteria bacterium]